MRKSMKFWRKISTPLVFCSSFFPMLVSAETSAWKTVGGWDISFYPNTGGCLAYTVYDGGIAFFIGLSRFEDVLNFDMTLMNDNWVSIEDKKEYEVVVTLGNEVPWTLEMTGVKFEKTWGMTFSTPANSDKAGRFADEFMREVAMEWTYSGKQLGYLSLSDSRLAFEEAVSCTKSFQDAIKDSSDPFSADVSNGIVDPFAN